MVFMGTYFNNNNIDFGKHNIDSALLFELYAVRVIYWN